MEERRMFALCVVLLALLCGPVRSEDGDGEGPLVRVENGELLGTVMTSLDGDNFFAFRGVPYAQPPVGKRRFKAPVALSGEWFGVRDATEEGPVCAQVPMMGSKESEALGDEDCLYLNVYTAKLGEGEEELLPVVFWIHGGAFYAGDGGVAENGPEFLMDQPIVLVTINYRIGPFGFLSSGNQVIPGNFGMKDQVMALKWVQKNIGIFGGDKNRVTLYGYSSGAACVQAHLFSPMSTGLFHGAIIQSGSLATQCSLRSQPSLVLQVLASVVQCNQFVDTAEQRECLKQKSAAELAEATYRFPWWGLAIPHVYTPVVEWKASSEEWVEEPFMTVDPWSALREGPPINDVPILTGVASDEAYGFALVLSGMEEQLNQLNKKFEDAARLGFCMKELSDKKMAKVRKFYFGNATIDSSQKENLSQMIGDAMFVWSQMRVATNHAAASKSPVYFYVFSFIGRITELMVFLPGPIKPPGVGHADDLAYAFRRRVPFPDGGPNREERDTIKRMGSIIANFAATGDPTPTSSELLPEKWDPVPPSVLNDPSSFQYLDISQQPAMRQGRPFAERMDFWEKLTKPPRKKLTTVKPSKGKKEEL